MHPSPSRRRIGLRLAIVAAIATVIAPLSFSAAQAAPPKPPPSVVKSNDAYVQSRCTFTVTSVNYAAGTLRGHLTAQTRGSNYSGNTSTAHVAVACYLYSGGYGSYLSMVSNERNGPGVYTSKNIQVPLFLDYDTCVSGVYTLRNGLTAGYGACS